MAGASGAAVAFAGVVLLAELANLGWYSGEVTRESGAVIEKFNFSHSEECLGRVSLLVVEKMAMLMLFCQEDKQMSVRIEKSLWLC